MTNQEIVDTVYDWFIVQGKPPSVNTSGVCMYWAEDGEKRCGVGCFVPEEVARKLEAEWPGCSVCVNSLGAKKTQTVGAFLVESGLIEKAQIPFISKIQGRHDDLADEERFHTRFRRELQILCGEEGLEYPGRDQGIV